jgi:hypothetical protein
MRIYNDNEYKEINHAKDSGNCTGGRNGKIKDH